MKKPTEVGRAVDMVDDHKHDKAWHWGWNIRSVIWFFLVTF